MGRTRDLKVRASGGVGETGFSHMKLKLIVEKDITPALRQYKKKKINKMLINETLVLVFFL